MALVAAVGAVPASAATSSSGGGTSFTNPPSIKAVKCHAGCADEQTASRATSSVVVKSGGTLKVSGRNLDTVKTVIFLGGKSHGDEARVAPASTNSKRLSVKVPGGAANGPIQLLDQALRKSKPSSVRVKLQLAEDNVDQNQPLRDRIVAVARTQLGVSEQPAGSNCQKYGPCEAWCADFSTWVWRKAGFAAIGRIPSVPNLVAWGRQHGTWKPGKDNNPLAGDMVIFSNLHVGLVERVSGGRITIIAGNTGGDNVARRGPAPTSAGTSMGPAPISGYVSPSGS